MKLEVVQRTYHLARFFPFISVNCGVSGLNAYAKALKLKFSDLHLNDLVLESISWKP